MAHTVHISSDYLRELDVFKELPATELEQLLRVGNVRHLEPRETISADSGTASASYYFLLRGVVAIAIEQGSPSVPPARASKRPPPQQKFLGYFETGAVFSGGYLSRSGYQEGPHISCVATNSVSLLVVPQKQLQELFARDPRWQRQLQSHMAQARQVFLARQDVTSQVVQDFFLRENYVTSSLVRIGRLDRCLDCNKCYDACVERHGTARMLRTGPRLGGLTFPVTCRNCHDKPCIAACSFGTISVDGATQDIHISDRCAGCGACAGACPNDAIFMTWRPYTVADFPDPMPQSTASGATNAEGVFVAGDVSGAALIRIAINDAVRAVDSIQPRQSSSGVPHVDVAIVGSGPAGLAAALRCRERNLTCQVLERDRLASTIRSYPKNKHVMAEPANVELRSSLWFEACSKEELLAHWESAVAENQIPVIEQAEVQRVEKSGSLFTVHTNRGTMQAEYVLICTGKRGTPRRLGLPGEVHPRVLYALDDAEAYAGRRVLVIGGGDSAIEAALALADAPNTVVTLSYRQGAFTRAKPSNRQQLERYHANGRIQVILKSKPTAIEPHAIRLMTEQGEHSVPNDVVFALLGADPPTEFLQNSGVRVLQPGTTEMAALAASRGQHQLAVKCDHCAGYSDRACLAACPTGALIEVPTDQVFLELDADPQLAMRRFSEIAFLKGVGPTRDRAKNWIALLTAVVLIAIGVECFLIRTQPESSLLYRLVQSTHAKVPVEFTSGRGIGHWLGYIGAGAMLASVLYSLRTRVKRFNGWGSQTGWLSTHIWLGLVGPALVTYHSTLKMDRWASIACILMWGVVATGAVRRYIFGRAHSAAGEAEFELDALRSSCRAAAEPFSTSRSVLWLMRDDLAERKASSTLSVLIWHELRDRTALLWLRAFGLPRGSDAQARKTLLSCLKQWTTQRRRSSYYSSLARNLRYWNVVHIVLAIAMGIIAIMHIVYGFMYKAV
jgi:thioredoxin reductase/formate hydrogenlyase subunit 6/NADH:ubiquinone oxidoreductase subunit I